ncbi:hypothetical protein B0H13DRAFT_1543857, partial [Mycena leptocephala]
LLFIGAELQDEDIPHCTKMSELISKRFQVSCLTLGCVRGLISLQSALGRLSFTHDIWTRVNLDSHLAITAHYIVRDE